MSTPATIPATISHASQTFLRAPERPIIYRLHTRFGDWFAGFRDAKSPVVTKDPLVTPWLTLLHAEYQTRTESEHRAMAAAIAVLDDMIATHRAAISRATSELEDVSSGTLPAVDAASVSAVDAADDPAIRQARKQRQADAALARSTVRADALRRTIEAAGAEIEVLESAKSSHRSLTAIRAAHLAHHYERRQATYVRRLTRRWTQVSLPAPLPEPLWCH